MNCKLARNRFLPKYVTAFEDRHGVEWLRFRRKGFESHYFKAKLGTEEFRAEYHLCMNPVVDPITITPQERGSLGDLRTQYFAVPSRLGPTLMTQAKVRSIIERFCEGKAHAPVSMLRFTDIERFVAEARVKRIENKRMVGGVEAARKLRKELIRLFAFAVKAGLMKHNPAEQAERVKVAPAERSRGFHTWTEDEIAQYRAKHAVGTKARLAMELILWTDQRKVDAIHLGRQHVTRGRLGLVQTKTGRAMSIKIAPQLAEAILAVPMADDQLCYLVNEYGKPFTTKGFGNRMRKWCDEAGLTHCTAHGLRKATMRRGAELNMGNQQLKSLSGHTKDDEVARYTAAASQSRLNDAAIDELSDWEIEAAKSNPVVQIDFGSTERRRNAG